MIALLRRLYLDWRIRCALQDIERAQQERIWALAKARRERQQIRMYAKTIQGWRCEQGVIR